MGKTGTPPNQYLPLLLLYYRYRFRYTCMTCCRDLSNPTDLFILIRMRDLQYVFSNIIECSKHKYSTRETSVSDAVVLVFSYSRPPHFLFVYTPYVRVLVNVGKNKSRVIYKGNKGKQKNRKGKFLFYIIKISR